ncbi:GNAT family N-acetyltransferase [Candidatus Woesearchaeota archaeon]|nr:GNAT family N-acetyltransferase [Candidatus Woesearchaeota archaeon]
MTITYKDGIDVDSTQLDPLWELIGWKPRGSQKWKEILSKSSYFVTAWDGDILIGCGRILEDGIMCMFYDIAVLPDHQGKGIGSAIMKKLIGNIKGKDYASIGLWKWEENDMNQSFYEKFGFVQSTSGMELIKHMHPE